MKGQYTVDKEVTIIGHHENANKSYQEIWHLTHLDDYSSQSLNCRQKFGERGILNKSGVVLCKTWERVFRFL